MSQTKSSLLSRCISTGLVFICKLLTGIQAHWQIEPQDRARIYYANHSSHLDGLVVWSCMPKVLRQHLHPVAAKDYWSTNRFRRYIAESVFKAVLISRKLSDDNTERRDNPLTLMSDVLEQGQSLLLFPEGTRNSSATIGEFKGGLYHLARKFPQVELVPVYLENLNRVLPKGTKLAVPIICSATFGPALTGLVENESKEAFLARAKEALKALIP